MARIEGEMRTLLDANGYAGQPIGAAMKALGKDPRFLFPNDDNGRKAALAEYKRLIDEATGAFEAAFRHHSRKRKSKCAACRSSRKRPRRAHITKARRSMARGPGIFYANLRDMNEVPKWSMPTLAYHEGVPGHHWQISTAQELKGVPQFRKMLPFTAYVEGWALYYGMAGERGGLV